MNPAMSNNIIGPYPAELIRQQDTRHLDVINNMLDDALFESKRLTDPELRERVINACAEYQSFIESVIKDREKKP